MNLVNFSVYTDTSEEKKFVNRFIVFRNEPFETLIYLIENNLIEGWSASVPKDKTIIGGYYNQGKAKATRWVGYWRDSQCSSIDLLTKEPKLAVVFEKAATNQKAFGKNQAFLSQKVNLLSFDLDRPSNLKSLAKGEALCLPITPEEIRKYALNFVSKTAAMFIYASSSVMKKGLPARKVGSHVLIPLSVPTHIARIKAYVNYIAATKTNTEYPYNAVGLNSSGKSSTRRALPDMSIYSDGRNMMSNIHAGNPKLFYQAGNSVNPHNFGKVDKLTHFAQPEPVIFYTAEEAKISQALYEDIKTNPNMYSSQTDSQNLHQPNRFTPNEVKIIDNEVIIYESAKMYHGDVYLGTAKELDNKPTKTNLNSVEDPARRDSGVGYAPGRGAGFIQQRSGRNKKFYIQPDPPSIVTYSGLYAPIPIENIIIDDTGYFAATGGGKSYHLLLQAAKLIQTNPAHFVWVCEPTHAAVYNLIKEANQLNVEIIHLVSGQASTLVIQPGKIYVSTAHKMYSTLASAAMDVTDLIVIHDEAHQLTENLYSSKEVSIDNIESFSGARYFWEVYTKRTDRGPILYYSGTLDEDYLPPNCQRIKRYRAEQSNPLTITDMMPLEDIQAGTHIVCYFKKQVFEMYEHLKTYTSLRIGYIAGKVSIEGTFDTVEPPSGQYDKMANLNRLEDYDVLVTTLAFGVGSSLPSTYHTSIVIAQNLTDYQCVQALNRVRGSHSKRWLVVSRTKFDEPKPKITPLALQRVTDKNYDQDDLEEASYLKLIKITETLRDSGHELKFLQTVEFDIFGATCLLRNLESRFHLSDLSTLKSALNRWSNWAITTELHPELTKEEFDLAYEAYVRSTHLPYWLDKPEDGKAFKAYIDSIDTLRELVAFRTIEVNGEEERRLYEHVESRTVLDTIYYQGVKRRVKEKAAVHTKTQEAFRKKFKKQERLNIIAHERTNVYLKIASSLDANVLYSMTGLIARMTAIAAKLTEEVRNKMEARKFLAEYGRVTYYKEDRSVMKKFGASAKFYSFEYGFLDMLDILAEESRPNIAI